jgi:hypothetical protein
MLLIADAIASSADNLGKAGLNAVIDEAIKLGDRMRGTQKGNDIADQLFAMVRRYGARIDVGTIDRMVLRRDSYSRSGLTSLGILYDEQPAHMRSLELPDRYEKLAPQVAFYCAFREAHPEHVSSDVMVDPSNFVFAGLRYQQPDRFWDKYTNRGPSALLDYLEPASVGSSFP